MAQSAEVSSQFVGAWSLVSWTQTPPGGPTEYPFGADAVGQLLYSADGHMAAHLMRRQRTAFRAEGLEDGSVEERAAAYLESFSYAGSYTVDWEASTVTHHVVVARDPDWVNRDLVRGFRFGADSLTLVSVWADGTTNTLVWERL